MNEPNDLKDWIVINNVSSQAPAQAILLGRRISNKEFEYKTLEKFIDDIIRATLSNKDL